MCAKRRREYDREDDAPAKTIPPLVIVAGVAGGALVLLALVVVAITLATRRDAAPGREAAGDMTLTAYVLQRPEPPTKVRAACRMTNYFNYEYRESSQTHYCFELAEGPGRIARTHAYARKDSDAGRRLFELTKDGGEAAVTLELRFVGPDGQRVAEPGHDVVAVTRLVSDR